jgi:hypothetical protein
MMIEIETPMCTVCGNTSKMFVDETAFYQWKSREILIQQAFPDMSLGDRELMKTGFHPECWDSLFTEEEA